jgi:uncharacterized membrane protein YqiK
LDFFGLLTGLGIGLLGFVIVLLVAWFIARWALGFRVIGSNQVGIVEKWWSPKGSLDKQIIALGGEAGYQPEVLRGGIQWKSPFMYRVHIMPLVTIPQGKIGYVFARDGDPLPPDQTLGHVVPDQAFQDARAWLVAGGQRGPQRAILREGTYAFNLAQFIIITETKTYYLPMGDKEEETTIKSMADHLSAVYGFFPVVIRGADDKAGVVTVQDGPSLPMGDIIAPTVGDELGAANYHNNFQDTEAFLRAGGYRGRQYQVLTEGTYFINRLFATVELIEKTVVSVGYAGVVVSYYGPKGEDISGSDYRHGELVENGHRGVWKDPLMPGKYAFNTYAGAIFFVPTTNIILKWITNETGVHEFDAALSEVALITKDAFEPSLPLSVVIHIDYTMAPLVIQRFGDIKMLVNQTLDPMVSAYFKNIGQTKTLIELIQQRSEIQDHSSVDMKEKFARYNLQLEEVLIGTPRSLTGDDKIEQILMQLRERQVAVEKLETFEKQKTAAGKERELKEAMAVAEQQTALTQSEINIHVQENQARAELQRAVQDAERVKTLAGADAEKIKLLAAGDAEKIKVLADADARKVTVMGEAEACRVKALAQADSEKAAKVGIGQAIAIEEQVRAYGGPQLQLIQDVMTKLAAAIQTSGVPIVPQTVVSFGDGEGGEGGKGGGGSSNNAFGLVMGLLATEKLGALTAAASAPADAEQAKSVAELKRQIMRDAGAAGMIVSSAPGAPGVVTRAPAPKVTASRPTPPLPTKAQSPARPPETKKSDHTNTDSAESPGSPS